MVTAAVAIHCNIGLASSHCFNRKVSSVHAVSVDERVDNLETLKFVVLIEKV